MERFWIDFGIDITGWFGSGCVLAAYGMLSLHRVTARSKLYHALNILGSLCLIVNTVFYSAYPSAFVNMRSILRIVWLLIAIFALINIFSRKQNEHT